jgi:hypothetical protein
LVCHYALRAQKVVGATKTQAVFTMFVRELTSTAELVAEACPERMQIRSELYVIFVPCTVIQLCNINQQTAHVSYLCFNSIIGVFYIFRTSCAHHQEDHWYETAQSVQRLVPGWTVLESNPGGGEISRPHPDRPWGPPSLLDNRYRVFPGGKAAGAWR